MHYHFVADSFQTQKLCSRLPSSEVPFNTEIGRFAFLSPHCGNLGATYDDRLRPIGKRVGDFLLVLLLRFKIGDFAPMGAGSPKISGKRGRPREPFFFSEN